MLLECNKVDEKKITYSTKQALLSGEGSWFVIGFMATVISGIISLYVFNSYFANRAASAAIEKYERQHNLVPMAGKLIIEHNK